MATNTDIKRVLKTYQSSAEKGLHGPSSYMSTESADCRKVFTGSSGCGSSSSTNDKTNKVHFKKLWASSQSPQQTSLCCVSGGQQTLPSKCHPDDLHLSSLEGDHHNRLTIYSTSYHPSPVGAGGKGHLIYHHQNDEWDLKYHNNQRDTAEPQAKCRRLSVVDNSSGKVYQQHHLSEHEDDGFDLEKKASLSSSSSAVGVSGRPGSYLSSKCCGGDDSFADKWFQEKRSSSGSHHHHNHHGGDGGGEVVMLTRHHSHPGNLSPRSTSNSYGGWADVGAFTPPSPYSPPNSMSFSSPPQMPFPLVMGPADDYGGKGEALLEGEMVACFSVGGERRLCFPQVLNASLKDFSLIQINAQNQALHIYLSYCSSRQLQCLKEDDVLPPTVKSCGLITYSDAHRLTHALLHFNAPPTDPPKTLTLPYNSSARQFVANSATTPLQLSVNSHSTNHHIPNIIVSHRSFGKCRGWVYLSLYDHPEAKCIQCCECRAFYTTTQFVCHAHRSLENRTCHWGFDPANWRIYLQLASDQPLQPIGSSLPATATLPEVYLEQFKTKFDPASLANRQRQAPDAHHQHQQRQQHRLVSPGPSVPTSSRPSSRTNPTAASFTTSVITLDADPRPASNSLDDPGSSLGGGCGGKAVSGVCLSALAVPSKDGNTFAPPPAAFVRESMPAPLPPNLQSKGPPVLADPGHVVPLSQYDKFRNCQPNVTLAPPLQKSRDSEKEVLVDLPTTTTTTTTCSSSKNAGAVQSVVSGKLSSSRRKDVRGRGGETENYSVDSSKQARENVVLRQVGGENKGYTISLCQSYKSQSGVRQHQNTSNSRDCSTSEATKGYTSSTSDSTGIKSTPDRRGCPNITDQRGYPVLSSELKLLSVDRSVVPKDLQIIKLDPSGAQCERNVVPSCRSGGDGSQCSVSKALIILKVEPSSGSDARPQQEVSNEDRHSSCRNSVARTPPKRRLCSSSLPEPTIKKECLNADEGTELSGNSQDQWRRSDFGCRSLTTRRRSHCGGTVGKEEEREDDEGGVSGEEQSSQTAATYSREREVVTRRKSATSAVYDTLPSSSAFFTSLTSTTSQKRGVSNDSACCYVRSGSKNNSSNHYNSNNDNNKDDSCNNDHDDTTNIIHREDGDVVVSSSRDIKLEPSHDRNDATLTDEVGDQTTRSCRRPSTNQGPSTISEASRNRSRVLVRSTTAAGVCCNSRDCSSAVTPSDGGGGGGGSLGRSSKERWSPTGRRSSLEAASEAASAVTEAEAILQLWEDKDSASRVTALMRSLVPLSVPDGSCRRHPPAPGGGEKKENPNRSQSPGGDETKASLSRLTKHVDGQRKTVGGSVPSGKGCTSVSEECGAPQTSGEKERHPSNKDGAPEQQHHHHQQQEELSQSPIPGESSGCSTYRCDGDNEGDGSNSNKCNHDQNSSCRDQASHLTSPGVQLPNESCKPREKNKQDRPSSNTLSPRDGSRTSREPGPVSTNNTSPTPYEEADVMKPPQQQGSPDRPHKPDLRRCEAVGSSSPARGAGAFATNAAVKRQHRDSTEQVPSQALEAKVRNLESELARVMAELSCYKKIKAEPVDENNSNTATTRTAVRDEPDRNYRKERQKRLHFSSKEESRREKMRQREQAAAAAQNDQHHLQQQQQHAGERESRGCYAQARVDAGGGGGDAGEERRHKSRERRKTSSSHRPDEGTELRETDSVRSCGKEQFSKRSKKEQSVDTEHGERVKGGKLIEEQEREAAKSSCSTSSSLSG